MLDAVLCVPRLQAATSDDVLRALGKKLHDAAKVRDSFVAAALAREKRSPTGLPFPGIAVALPHAEPEHVVSPALAVASLASPIVFRQMGSPSTKLSVSLVVMPALTAKDQAAGALAKLIEALQDEPLRRALVEATTSEAILAALTPVVGA